MASKRQRSASPQPASDDIAALRARVNDLEAREAEHARAERVQAALYRIAEAASASSDLQEFYRTIHGIVGELIYAENFYIALYDAERGRMNYPYFVDEFDEDIPDPNAWEPFGEGQARGITAYALRLGRPLRIDARDVPQASIESGEIEPLGAVTDEAVWLGVPLPAEGRSQGVLVIQSYAAEHAYTDADLELLTFVGQHVGSALSRVRAIEETRQRNAELALINEIGEALARQLDFDAIVDLVGERVRAIFDAADMFVAIHDADHGLIALPVRHRPRQARRVRVTPPRPGPDFGGDPRPGNPRASRRWRS